MSALQIEKQTPGQQNPAYWLSLYENGELYDTIGQTSYVQAHKRAAIWALLRDAGHSYQIMHEMDGFKIIEEPDVITQKCQQEGCAFQSRYSRYGVDRAFMQRERISHLARHDRARQRNFKIFFVCMVLVLIVTILGICGRVL